MPKTALAPSHRPRLLTGRDYNLLPEGGPHYQLIQGTLHMAPSPSFDHQKTAVTLVTQLAVFVAQHKLGEVLLAPLDVHLDLHNVYQPDLLFISEGSRHIISEKCIKGAPDLVIEILSQSTKKLDLLVKYQAYLRCGVSEIWFVDRKAKLLTQHDFSDPSAPVIKRLGPTETLQSRLLPGLKLELKSILAS